MNVHVEVIKTQLVPTEGSFYFSLLPAKCFSILKSKLMFDKFSSARLSKPEANEGFDEPSSSGTRLYFGIVTTRH